MALVIVGPGSGAALLHRQARLGAVQCLDLALLVKREHQRPVRRVEVEANDIRTGRSNSSRSAVAIVSGSILLIGEDSHVRAAL
jgi:hypothetical protein